MPQYVPYCHRRMYGGRMTHPPSQQFPGEHHMRFIEDRNDPLNPKKTWLDKTFGSVASWAGPGTHVKERLALNIQPINSVDAIAKKHDIDYMHSLDKYNSKAIDKNEFMREIHEADDSFINSLSQSAIEEEYPISANIAKEAIRLKKNAEISGFPSKVFSGAGAMDGEEEMPVKKNNIIKELIRPIRANSKLKQMVQDELKQIENKPKDKQQGGFPPLLLPIASAIIGSLVSKGVDFVIDKMKGSGVKILKKHPLKTKREMILKHIESLPKKDQILFLMDLVK